MGRIATIDSDRLLDAAADLLAETGASGLTLEAVAERAGVSKGGLQYSFPSKRALVQAMLDRMADRLDAAVAAALGREPEGPGRLARAYVRGSLGHAPAPRPARAALLAAAALDPRMLEGRRDAYREMHGRLVADGLAAPRAAVVMLATDGFLLLDLLGLLPFAPAERDAIADELAALSKET